MKKRMKNKFPFNGYLLSLVSCLIPTLLYGQIRDCRCHDDSRTKEPDEKITFIVLPSGEVKLPRDEVFAQWRYGRIFLNSGEIIPGEFMYYDGLTDQLIVDSKSPDYRLMVDKFTILGFDLESLNSDQVYRFRRMNVRGKTMSEFQDVFLQVLVSGKNSLYVYRKMVKTPEPGKLDRYYCYFIKKEDGSMVSFTKPSRHTLYRLFPEKKDLFRNLFRKRHVRIRNEVQLMNSIEMLNTL